MKQFQTATQDSPERHSAEDAPSIPQDNPPQPSLETIQQSLDHMSARIERIAKATHADKKKEPAAPALRALVFAVVGWKLSALAFGKAGYLVDLSLAIKRDGFKGLKEMAYSIVDLVGRKEGAIDRFGNLHKYMIIGGGVGTPVGLALGAVIGITRGDRLESPGDLFLHPIDSYHRLVAKNPPPKEDDAPTTPKARVEADRQYHGALYETNVHSVIAK